MDLQQSLILSLRQSISKALAPCSGLVLRCYSCTIESLVSEGNLSVICVLSVYHMCTFCVPSVYFLCTICVVPV